MRDGEWKMIVKGDRVQLFNLANDIGEQRNLVAEHPKRAEMMREAIRRWKDETKYRPLQ